MKTVTFEERFFANKGEWEYFLSQLGIKDDDENRYIDSITILVDKQDIKIEYQNI